MRCSGNGRGASPRSCPPPTAMNKYLIPKERFATIIEDGKRDELARDKLWSEISNPILRDRNAVPRTFHGRLTVGQRAVVCCAEFVQAAKYDFLSSITESELPSRTLKAFEDIGAEEYSELLRQVESVFPEGRFPQYAEDMLAGLRKQPRGYFDEVVDQFVIGTGMKRRLRDYVFEYVTNHPDDFRTTS